jgi:hypothetical protein
MAELRDQRSHDSYLENHRRGDLRRYKEFYNVDLFPKGPYPGFHFRRDLQWVRDLLPASRELIHG